MISVIIGLVGGLLMALDVQRNLRTGVATTLLGSYPRVTRTIAFWIVCATKALLSAALALLAAWLIVRNSP